MGIALNNILAEESFQLINYTGSETVETPPKLGVREEMHNHEQI